MKHPHAELMMQYAQDAMETDKPWERWEFGYDGETWDPLRRPPIWDVKYKYRRKPRTITINGFEVPEPVRYAPKYNQQYYIPAFANNDYYIDRNWHEDGYDMCLLKNGFVHLDKEPAISHAKALLSFTERKK